MPGFAAACCDGLQRGDDALMTSPGTVSLIPHLIDASPPKYNKLSRMTKRKNWIIHQTCLKTIEDGN